MSHPLERDWNHVLEHTADIWPRLRGARIFITGGTGFFGRWLLETFAWADNRFDLGASVEVLTRDPEAFSSKAPRLANCRCIRFHAGDVRRFDFPPGEFTHVIHAAAAASATAGADPLEMLDLLAGGARHTLDFAVACRCQGFLLTSSGAVYGPQPAELSHLSEACRYALDTMDPASAYGEGKRVAELLCAIYHHRRGLNAKIARCFTFLGPHLPLDGQYAAGNFLRDALSGKPVERRGHSLTRRSYLYAADLAIWLWRILLDGHACRPYHVGSEDAVTMGDLASRIAEEAGAPCRPGPVAETGPESSPGAYVPSTRRASGELALEQWIPLDDAIRRSADWFRRHSAPSGGEAQTDANLQTLRGSQ